MAKIKNERITDSFVRKMLKESGYDNDDDLIVDEQTSTNKSVNNLLSKSSKNQNGNKGSPDFIIYSKTKIDLVILIENKFDVNDHCSKNLSNLSKLDNSKETEKYGVDGILWYSSFLKQHYNVIGIAVSGTIEKNIISIYKIPKYEKKIYAKEEKSVTSIKSFDKFYESFEGTSEVRFSITDGEISIIANKINQVLRDKYKLSEDLKPLLISLILIGLNGLQNEMEDGSLFIKEKSEFLLFDNFLKRCQDEFKTYDSTMDEKTNFIIKQFETLSNTFKSRTEIKKKITANKNDFEKYNSDLANIIDILYHNVFKLMKNIKYNFDPIGVFYSKFLKYSTGDGKGLGIVLTPNHITDLFTSLANNGSGLNLDDIIIDTCAGTGGFLISAYKKLMNLATNDKERNQIKEKSIFGFEMNPKMFVLALTNMILLGDGKTNLIQDNSFKNTKFNGIPNIAFINPPYSQKEDDSEFKFIEEALKKVRKENGEVIAIIPIGVINKKDFKTERNDLLKKYTLKAVITMPDDLFYPIGTNTAIVIFSATRPHDFSKKVWMGRLKSDGFEKVKHKGRIDLNNRWEVIKNELITMYKNQESDIQNFKYIKQEIKQGGDWIPESYVKTDFNDIPENLFEKKLKEQISYRVSNDIPIKTDYNISNHKISLYDSNWKIMKYSDLFNIERTHNIGKLPFTIKRIEKKLAEKNKGDIPYVSSSALFHGITAYTSIEDNLLIAPIFSLNNSGSVGRSYYHEKDFISCDSVFAFSFLKQYIDELDVFVGLFITTLVELERYRYGFGLAWRSERLLNSEISLPIDANGKINFDFMRKFMKQFPHSWLL